MTDNELAYDTRIGTSSLVLFLVDVHACTSSSDICSAPKRAATAAPATRTAPRSAPRFSFARPGARSERSTSQARFSLFGDATMAVMTESNTLVNKIARHLPILQRAKLSEELLTNQPGTVLLADYVDIDIRKHYRTKYSSNEAGRRGRDCFLDMLGCWCISCSASLASLFNRWPRAHYFSRSSLLLYISPSVAILTPS